MLRARLLRHGGLLHCLALSHVVTWCLNRQSVKSRAKSAILSNSIIQATLLAPLQHIILSASRCILLNTLQAPTGLHAHSGKALTTRCVSQLLQAAAPGQLAAPSCTDKAQCCGALACTDGTCQLPM